MMVKHPKERFPKSDKIMKFCSFVTPFHLHEHIIMSLTSIFFAVIYLNILTIFMRERGFYSVREHSYFSPLFFYCAIHT
jgi:hypothetical protein